MVKMTKILPVIAGFAAGFGLGILFEEVQIKKKAEKYVEESLNKAVQEDTKEKNEALTAEINKKTPEKEAKESYESAIKPYQSSAVEQVDVKVVKMDEKKEGEAENASQFRPGKIRICSENEYIAAVKSNNEYENIVYYTGDECFYNSDGNRVEEPDLLFGPDIMGYFGTTSGDPDLVHIYNKEEDVYYEIERKLGCCPVK